MSVVVVKQYINVYKRGMTFKLLFVLLLLLQILALKDHDTARLPVWSVRNSTVYFIEIILFNIHLRI